MSVAVTHQDITGQSAVKPEKESTSPMEFSYIQGFFQCFWSVKKHKKKKKKILVPVKEMYLFTGSLILTNISNAFVMNKIKFIEQTLNIEQMLNIIRHTKCKCQTQKMWDHAILHSEPYCVPFQLIFVNNF